MAVIDKINRKGIDGKRVITGPTELVGPKSGDTKSDFSRLSGILGAVDQYEITDGAGTNAGAYTITLRAYSENGFTASHRAVGDVAVLRQINGIAAPGAAVNCLDRKKPSSGTSPVTFGPFTVLAGDRLWVVVEHKDYSTLKYQLEVDFSV
jgi:hypothetical protein